MSSSAATLGIDIGGTKAQAGILGGDGVFAARNAIATGVSFSPATLIEFVAVVRDAAPGVAVEAIGIGFPGLVEPGTGRVLSSVILPGWEGVPLSAIVRDHFRMPCGVANDVDNAARAEAHVRGPAETDLFFVSVGTGIGGAWWSQGSLRGGASGLAGEIGHTVVSDGPPCPCGRNGCVGALASGRAIEARLGLERGGLEEHMRAPTPADHAVIREAGAMLGRAIANLIHLLHPALVVIGGGIAVIPGFVEAAADTAESEVIADFRPRPRIERARAGYDAGALGGALLGRACIDHDGAPNGRRA